MEKILNFKKDYLLCINNLSDKDAGIFIKALANYYFNNEEVKVKNPLIAIYMSLIRPSINEERRIQEELIIDEDRKVNQKQSVIDGMYKTIKTLEDLIDFEVSKLFLKEEQDEPRKNMETNR